MSTYKFDTMLVIGIVLVLMFGAVAAGSVLDSRQKSERITMLERQLELYQAADVVLDQAELQVNQCADIVRHILVGLGLDEQLDQCGGE